MNKEKNLIVIMPVYNEEDIIASVLEKWVSKLDSMQIEGGWQIQVYNDGSKDCTAEILTVCAERHPEKIIVHNKPNSGHGPTILQGYRENASKAEWLFQIDSDDEMGPEGFPELWYKRENYDFLAGFRDGRKQALPRKIISAVSRLSVRLFYGKSIWDVNTPYRLMRVSAFKTIWEDIPANTFAPNVIISGMAGCNNLRCYEIRLPQQNRHTGEISIKKWKLLKAAVKSFWQTIVFSIVKANFFYPVSYLLSILIFSIIINNCPFAIKPQAATDSDVFFVIGRALRDGLIPYKDIFDHKGPLIYFIDAMGDFLWGFRGIGTIEILFWIIFLLILGSIQKILKLELKIFNIIILLLPFLVEPTLYGGNMTGEFALPLIAYGNFYLIKLCMNKEVELKDSFLCGICSVSTFFLKPNMIAVFFVDGLALLFFLLIQEKKYLSFFQNALFGLIGMLFIAIPIGIFFYSANALQNMYFCIWEFNLMYSQHTIPIYKFFVEMVCRVIYNNYLFIPLLMSVLLLSCKNREKNFALYFFLALNVFFSILTSIFARTIFIHYFIVMIPVYAILLAMFLSIVKIDFKQIKYPILFCGIFLICIESLPWDILNKFMKPNRSSEIQEAANFLFSNVRSIDKTLVLGNNCILYEEFGLKPDFKYIYQEPIIRISPAVKKDFLQTIIRREYVYIIDPICDERFPKNDISDHITQEIYYTISRYYSPVFSNSQYVIYKRQK